MILPAFGFSVCFCPLDETDEDLLEQSLRLNGRSVTKLLSGEPGLQPFQSALTATTEMFMPYVSFSTKTRRADRPQAADAYIVGY